jgi:hypothetical protein
VIFPGIVEKVHAGIQSSPHELVRFFLIFCRTKMESADAQDGYLYSRVTQRSFADLMLDWLRHRRARAYYC